MNRIPQMTDLAPGVVWTLLGLGMALFGATVLRGGLHWCRPSRETQRGWRSLATWWALYLLLGVVLVSGPLAVALSMAFVSFLLLRESLSVISRSSLLLPLTLLCVGVYLWAWLAWPSLFLGALPSALLLAAMVVGALGRLPGKGWREGPWVLLAFLLSVAGLSFVVGVVRFPFPEAGAGGWAGPLLGLLILTELNDMAQSWWGRALGSHPLAPGVSPGKSWEGFWGGLATTVLAGVFLLPAVSPFGRVAPPEVAVLLPPWGWPAVTALVTALAGVAGDLAASRLKRKAGVKDAGDLLPAHGGLLDRFDSLALSAPAFFYLSFLLWGRPS